MALQQVHVNTAQAAQRTGAACLLSASRLNSVPSDSELGLAHADRPCQLQQAWRRIKVIKNVCSLLAACHICSTDRGNILCVGLHFNARARALQPSPHSTTDGAVCSAAKADGPARTPPQTTEAAAARGSPPSGGGTAPAKRPRLSRSAPRCSQSTAATAQADIKQEQLPADVSRPSSAGELFQHTMTKIVLHDALAHQ